MTMNSTTLLRNLLELAQLQTPKTNYSSFL